IVPNKFAATALLARMYLYSREWEKAEDQATQIINSLFFALTPDLNDVFKPNSSEAIWQLQQDNTSFSFNGIGEGTTIIPRAVPVTFGPFAYLTTSLLNSFEPDDNRKEFWINSKTINNTAYFYPYKYKIGPSEAIANGSYTE